MEVRSTERFLSPGPPAVLGRMGISGGEQFKHICPSWYAHALFHKTDSGLGSASVSRSETIDMDMLDIKEDDYQEVL